VDESEKNKSIPFRRAKPAKYFLEVGSSKTSPRNIAREEYKADLKNMKKKVSLNCLWYKLYSN